MTRRHQPPPPARRDAAGTLAAAPGGAGRTDAPRRRAPGVGGAGRSAPRCASVAFTARARASDEGARLAAALAGPARDRRGGDRLGDGGDEPGRQPVGRRRHRRSARLVAGRARSSIPPQLVVAAVDVQDPGNVGAIVRAAEACGATGVVCCGTSADPFGWKALRGSMGSALRLPVASGVPVDRCRRGACERGAFASSPPSRRAARGRTTLDLRQPTALLFGGEGPGPDRRRRWTRPTRVVSIPMRAPVESLNVAVAVALLTLRSRAPARRRSDGPDA